MVGDPRYWSPAHYVKLLFGDKHMEMKHPDLYRLYQERLDYYSFGCLLLELIFGIWKCPTDDSEIGPELRAIISARASWRRYWRIVCEIFQILHKNGANLVNSGKEIVGGGLHAAFLEAHQQLCSAIWASLGRLDNVCYSEIVPLLVVVVEFINPVSTLEWQHVPELLAQDATSVFDDPRFSPHITQAGSDTIPVSGSINVSASPMLDKRAIPGKVNRKESGMSRSASMSMLPQRIWPSDNSSNASASCSSSARSDQDNKRLVRASSVSTFPCTGVPCGGSPLRVVTYGRPGHPPNSPLPQGVGGLSTPCRPRHTSVWQAVALPRVAVRA